LNIEAVRVIVKSMRRQIYKPCESACRVFESVEAERLLIEAVRVNMEINRVNIESAYISF